MCRKKLIVYLGANPSDVRIGKTGHCLVQFAAERIAAFLVATPDAVHIADIYPEFAQLDIPVYHSEEIEQLDKSHQVVIGFATIGGVLAACDQAIIHALLQRGFTVLNTLHAKIADGHKNVISYRENTVTNCIASGKLTHAGKRILFVGMDVSLGKMTATVALCNAMQAQGVDADWVATGQTGKLLKDGNGLVLDSMVIDFMPGNLEAFLNQQTAKYLLIEGQGSIFHPSYSPTSFGLLHTCKPDYLILCHDPEMVYGYLNNKLPSVPEAIRFYETLADMLGIPCKVIGVALNTRNMDEAGYLAAKSALEQELSLPCCDVMREDPFALVAQVLA